MPSALCFWAVATELTRCYGCKFAEARVASTVVSVRESRFMFAEPSGAA